MMIARHWRGLAKTEHADAYVGHLRSVTFPRLSSIAGFAGATIHRRPVESGVEFLVVTTWESMDALGAFAGEDVEAAVVPPEVHRMLIEYDTRVRHYEVLPA